MSNIPIPLPRSDNEILASFDYTQSDFIGRDFWELYLTLASRSFSSIKQFGAAGDGVTDDSAAVSDWIDHLLTTGETGIVPPGVYRVPNIAGKIISAPLRIIGAGSSVSIFDGEYNNTDPTTGILVWLQVNAPLSISGIRFKRMTTVAAIADGTGRTGLSSSNYRYEDWRGNWMSGDIELIEFDHCAFEDVRRAFLGAMQNEGWILKKFVFANNLVDGAWGGVIMSGVGYQQVRILNNTFLNIDGTPAGYTLTGTPIVNFSSRAVMIGMNRESASDAQFATNRDWQYGFNRIINVIDTRTHASTKPEVHGFDLRCASHVHGFYNDVRELSSAEIDECEAYYHRDVWYQSSHYETAHNAGTKESSWTSKGNQRYAYVEGLTISADDAYNAIDGSGGIVFTGLHGTFKDCTLVNVGRKDSTDRGVVTFNGGSQTDVAIENLKLINCHTRYGIDIACSNLVPGYFTIRGGLISGQDAAFDASTVAGITKRSSADIHLTIDGMEFEDFSTPTNSDQRAIRLMAGAEGDVVIRNCKLRLRSLRTPALRWTQSASGTGEFYLEASAGGSPGIKRPKRVFENGAAIPTGTLGSLAASRWNWGDNDSLGFSTVYIRLADDTDPDTKAESYVKMSTFNEGILLEGTWTGIKLDLFGNYLDAASTPLNTIASPPTTRALWNYGVADV